MLISIVGDIRTGKTFLMVLFALATPKPFYSNIKIKDNKFNELTEKNLISLPDNSDVFIDEAYTWLESRRSGKDRNLLASYILFQSGKLTVNIYLTIQFFKSIDLRFREMTNILIDTSKDMVNKFFRYDVYHNHKGVFVFNKTIFIPFEKAEKYFSYYDTFEIVRSDLMDKFELDAILNDKDNLFRYIQDLAVEIKPFVKDKSTVNKVKMAMVELKYPLEFIKKLSTFVNIYLNENK